jgi:hypothetical protein
MTLNMPASETVKPRLAVVSTAFYPKSHSDVIVSRWLEPRPTDAEFGWPVGAGEKPRTEIASMYVAQFPENDMARETAERYNVPLFSTVRETLTMGGDSLAVDGVLLIGEHGNYPSNEWFQKMYPRRELFDEIVAVFRESGRSVPVFCDKHVSYNAASAQHMVSTSRELNFPLMAGSSIPLCGFINPWQMPEGTALSEGIGVFYDSMEAYGYHSIEFLQSLVARREGGESGIESVAAYYGDSFWEAEAAGLWSNELMQVAVQQAHNRKPGNLRDNLSGPLPPKPFAHQWPAAFCFHHRDGLRTTHLMLHGHVADFSVAVLEKSGVMHGGCSHCSVNQAEKNYFAHFAMLNAKIEEFMLTDQSPYPLDYYLLSTLAIGAAIRALARPGQRMATPDLILPYRL